MSHPLGGVRQSLLSSLSAFIALSSSATSIEACREHNRPRPFTTLVVRSVDAAAHDAQRTGADASASNSGAAPAFVSWSPSSPGELFASPGSDLPTGYVPLVEDLFGRVSVWFRDNPRWFWRGAVGCTAISLVPRINGQPTSIVTESLASDGLGRRVRYFFGLSPQDQLISFTDGRRFEITSGPLSGMPAAYAVSIPTAPMLELGGPIVEERQVDGTWATGLVTRGAHRFLVVFANTDRLGLVADAGLARGYRVGAVQSWFAHREDCESTAGLRETPFGPCL